MLDNENGTSPFCGLEQGAHPVEDIGGGLGGAEHQKDWAARVYYRTVEGVEVGKRLRRGRSLTAFRMWSRTTASSSTSSTEEDAKGATLALVSLLWLRARCRGCGAPPGEHSQYLLQLRPGSDDLGATSDDQVHGAAPPA